MQGSAAAERPWSATLVWRVLAEALMVPAVEEAAVGTGVGPWGGGIAGRSRTPPPYLEAARVRPGLARAE